MLNVILVDTKNGQYSGGLDPVALSQNGIRAINCRLVSMRSNPWIDEKLLVLVLLSLAWLHKRIRIESTLAAGIG